MKKFLQTVFCVLTLILSEKSHGQSPSNSGGKSSVSTVLLSGLAGGILGLSTLSFYKHPEDHINNIPVGAAIGLIFSTLYISYNGVSEKTAYQPKFLIAPDFLREKISLVYVKNF